MSTKMIFGFVLLLGSILILLTACKEEMTLMLTPTPAPPPQGLVAPSPSVTSDPGIPAPTPTTDPRRRPDTSISTSAITSDGSFWYAFDQFDSGGGTIPGSSDQGLFRLKDGEVFHYDIAATIRVLGVSPDGLLYVGAGCGVLRFIDEHWETLLPLGCAARDRLQLLYPLDIVFDDAGNLWVGGLFTLAKYDGESWQEYAISAHRIALDEDGTIWARGWDGRADSNCCLTQIRAGEISTFTWSANIPAGPAVMQDLFDLSPR